MAALAVGGGYWAAMTLAPATSKPTPVAPLAAVEVSTSTSGEAAASGGEEQLILEVLETLERRPNIAAKIRQSVRIGDDRLTGEGEFWQQGVGNQRRTRWELTTLVAGERAFVTQVYDGEFVWTDRKLPASRQITRVDLGTFQRELAASADAPGQGRGPVGESITELLARGGMSQLVAGMHRYFTFGSRQTLRRGDQTIFAVVGQWRPEQLEAVWPGMSAADPSDWPAHLPHHVMLYVGASDRFPYLVEYRGGDQAYLAASPDGYIPAHHSQASFEFIDVQFASVMPADIFQFTPPVNSWHDITARVLAELRPPAAATTETSAARRTGAWR
jgi:hypothetical protein